MSFYTAIRRFCLARPPLTESCIGGFFSQQVLSSVINIEWPLSIEYSRVSDCDFADTQPANIVEIQCYSLDEIHVALAEVSAYPFRVNLGNLHPWLVAQLSAPPTGGNRTGFAIDSATIECHPIIHVDDDGEPFKLGQFALSLHGPGYLFPLTKQDILTSIANNDIFVQFIRYIEFYFEPPPSLIDDTVASIFDRYCDDKEYGVAPNRRYFWHISEYV